MIERFVVHVLCTWSGIESLYRVNVWDPGAMQASQVFIHDVLKHQPKFISEIFERFFAPVASDARNKKLDQEVADLLLSCMPGYDENRKLDAIVKRIAQIDAINDFAKIKAFAEQFKGQDYADVVKFVEQALVEQDKVTKTAEKAHQIHPLRGVTHSSEHRVGESGDWFDE
jgi:hypothetical protein